MKLLKIYLAGGPLFTGLEPDA